MKGDKMTREAAYWSEFLKEAIRTNLAREIPRYNVIEALALIKILVDWKERHQLVDGDRIVKEWWTEGWGFVIYKPGQVLYRKWRPASGWEIEKWKDLSQERLKEFGVFRKNGVFSVEIVEKVVDLPAAIRQLGRHIPSKKVARTREKFTLLGDAPILAQYASRLTKLLEESLENQKPSSQLMKKTSQEMDPFSRLLERSKSSFKRKISQELKLAQEGKFWQIQTKTSQAISLLLEQRAEDYEIAVKSIESAKKLRELMTKIDRRCQGGYNRLGHLGEELQNRLINNPPSQKELVFIAKGADAVRIYLKKNIPNFEPYYSRIQAPEFQGLSRAVEYAEAGKGDMVLNDILKATAKLEAVALGERPTQSELKQMKEELS